MSNITRRAFLSLALGAIVTAATPRPAQAIPRKFRGCPRIKQNGIAYLLYKRYAIVARTPNRKSVTIPNSIKLSGKTYVVSAIWDGTFSRTPKLRRIVLKAKNLETIEDPSIFRGRISVITYDRSTYRWLKSAGVKATLHK